MILIIETSLSSLRSHGLNSDGFSRPLLSGIQISTLYCHVLCIILWLIIQYKCTRQLSRRTYDFFQNFHSTAAYAMFMMTAQVWALRNSSSIEFFFLAPWLCDVGCRWIFTVEPVRSADRRQKYCSRILRSYFRPADGQVRVRPICFSERPRFLCAWVRSQWNTIGNKGPFLSTNDKNNYQFRILTVWLHLYNI